MKKNVVWLSVVCFVAGCGLAMAEPSGFLYLGNTPVEAAGVPLLQREILRQAVSTVGREGLGLVVRDAVLGAPVPEQTAVQLSTQVQLEGANNVSLSVTQMDSTQPIWRETYGRADYAKLLETVEAATTTALRKELLELQTYVKPAPPTGAMPALTAVDSASLPDLFELLRTTHAYHSFSGGTPMTYDVLVRGYANLGQLSSRTWNAAYKVYQARALLYAQRFVRTNPDDAQARFLRAYAFGMCGLHAHALDDLAAAREMAPGAEPQWGGMLDDLLHFRTAPLLAVANSDDPHSYTAWVMTLMTMDKTPFRSRPFSAHSELQHKPMVDLRTLFQLNEMGGVSTMHKTTTEGFEQMTCLVGTQLAQHSLLPDSVRNKIPGGFATNQSLRERIHELPIDSATKQQLLTVMDQAAGNPTILEQLETVVSQSCRLSADPNPQLMAIPNLHSAMRKETQTGLDKEEPSLAAFGNLLYENLFAVVIWRQYFMDKKWSVDIDQFTQQFLPAVAEHPCKNLLTARSAKRHLSPSAYLAQLEALNLPDLPAGAQLLFEGLYDEDAMYGSTPANELLDRYMATLDRTHHDLQRGISLTENKQQKVTLADQLLEISPYSPFARRIKLTDQDNWKELCGQYEAEGLLAPELSQLVGWRYRKDKQYEKAIPYYELALSQIQESYVYASLADCYLKTKDQTRWLETMEHRLTLPDYGLSHASTRADIAKHFMRKGKLNEAQPYADKAAESYAQWSLSLAGECAMANGDQLRAKELLIKEQTRYEQSTTPPWKAYFKAQVFQVSAQDSWFHEISTKISENLKTPRDVLLDSVFCGFHHWRNKQLEKAAASFDAAFRQSPDVWYSILRAMVLLEADEQDRYTQQLNQIIDDFESTKTSSRSRHQIREIAKVMRDYANGSRTKETLYADLLDLKKRGTLYPADFYFFIGKYASLIGMEPEAVQLFYKGIQPGQIDRWAGPFCYLELQDRTFDPFARYHGTIPEYPVK